MKLQQNMGSWCGALTNMHWKFGQKVQLWWVAYRSEEMDPTNAIYNYAVLDKHGIVHKVRQWEADVRIWVGNDNVWPHVVR